jgi:hypothetical protein
MAFTSISLVLPIEWHDPLAEHPEQSPVLMVFTHAALESVLITMPCSVAKFLSFLSLNI